MKVMLKEMPQSEVAYIRRTGSYFEPQEHWGKLIHWAISNGLYPPAQSFIGISLDNPDTVEATNCRHDACVTIPESFEKEKHPDMQFMRLDGGQYAVYSFYDAPDQLNQAYQYVFGEWLPDSEYEADPKRPTLEYNLNNPAEDPEGKCKVDLYVPVAAK
ncbi:AraC family transcriptional regulator [Bacillus mangrovi]|uniref:AraC family transcriptional regulator n=1 Tax=Metabacillus mangrovi TaxID=1491830 RepID=A0A7X2S7F5_9BACI|nr:GyrI-like domain-containing protein [Metabacillus mangrovi]MTH54875.1 AraC family transcriptional regulator [Metabacillus mangrovi]